MTSSEDNGQAALPGRHVTRWRWLRVALLLWLACAGARAALFVPSQTTFSETTVGATSPAVTVTLTAQGSGSADTAVAMTEGVAAQNVAEFAVSSSGTCGSGQTFSPGQSCAVTVTFSPRYPGVRHGAVVLKTSGGQLLASTLISGVGRGGLPVLVPGEIDTVAGDGQWFYQGDGVPARQAPIYLPSGLAVDGAGNLYLSDSINNRVRRVDAVTHIISTVAGNGSAGSSGDGLPATSAQLASPSGLALDGAGNLYIADSGNNTIRRVDAVSGVITTVAGTPGVSGYAGDGGPAVNAKLNAPQGLAISPSGDLIVADTSNAVVRVLTMQDGRIETVAGTGTAGYNGDGIAAVTAQLNSPAGVAVRSDGAIAIADLSNNRVRLIAVNGNISTIAGTGALGYTGDGQPATQAKLQGPAAVAFDPAGDLILADSSNNCIRLVYGAQGTIVTLAGTPDDDRYAGDAVPEDQARMHGPVALVFDPAGNLWLADHFNNRVREIHGSLLTLGPYPTMKVGKTSQPMPEQMLNGGNADLVLRSPTLQEAALGASTTCGQDALQPGVFCGMGVAFAPTEIGDSVHGAITWTSDAPNVTPLDQLYGQVLSVEPTSVSLQADANPGLSGQTITLTATVASADKGRTGTVDFSEGSTTWCSQRPLGANGTATCAVPGLALGTHTFIANYSGDNNNAASQSAGFDEVMKQKPALALGVSSNPAVVGSRVVLSLQAADGTGTPTGTVVFYDGATALGSAVLDATGSAAWSSTAFSVGTHNVSVQYAGDSANVPGVSNTVTLEVDRASTLTVLNSGTNHEPVGTALSFRADVVSRDGPSPTGTVQLLDGTTLLGTTAVNADGSAPFSVSNLSPGDHAITAVYGGDANTANSTSVVLSQTVQQITTTTTLGTDANPLQAGSTVHLTAAVVLAPGATSYGALTGSVIFSEGGTVLGRAIVGANGQATLSVPSLHVGLHALVATFSGNVNYAPSASGVLNEEVQQTPSVVTLSTQAASVLMGKTATFTAVVSSATGIPTGSVLFREGATTLGSAVVDASGKALWSTTRLSAGAHTVVASYNGDANYLAATSGGLLERVSLAQPVVTLSSPAVVGDAGVAVRFSAALATEGVDPTGTLSLLDGAVVVASTPVQTNGTMQFQVSSLSVGPHQLTATYGGDLNNAAAMSAVVPFTVQLAPTSTTLVASANPLTRGQALTLRAVVQSDSPHPGSQVRFLDGTVTLANVPLSADGSAEFVANGLALGNHVLTATYSGDSLHASSTSAVLPELVVEGVSLAIASNQNPSVSGQEVVFTGRFSGTPAPTGSLTFRDGSALLATVPLSGGVASFSMTTLSVGTHLISAMYDGDLHYAATNATLSQAVLLASTNTSLSVDQNPGTYGSAVTFVAVVSSNGGAATGLVRLEEAGNALASAALDAQGRAVFLVSKLLPGSHQIVATYLGDGKADTSSSRPLALAVKQSTQLRITSSANPALTLSPVALTATVTNAGAAPASGRVMFFDAGAPLGTVAVGPDGRATLPPTQMGAGRHTITASYEGDSANFASEAPALDEVIQLRPTSTTVTGTSTDKTNPQQVTLIGVVRSEGSVPPGGLVTFTSGAVTLGVAPVDATGVASITVIFKKTLQQIVASYSGDLIYSGSASAATPIAAGTPAQFTLALSSSAVTLASHQRTTITVTVASVKSFTDQIGLGCLGLPYAATCTFDRAQVKLHQDGTETVSLIVDTGNPLGAGTSVATGTLGGPRLLLCFSPLSMLLFGACRRRRRLPALLVLALGLAAATGTLTGCGGLQMRGTPPGTYSFQVIGTGQGSNTTESQPLQLVVTP